MCMALYQQIRKHNALITKTGLVAKHMQKKHIDNKENNLDAKYDITYGRYILKRASHVLKISLMRHYKKEA